MEGKDFDLCSFSIKSIQGILNLSASFNLQKKTMSMVNMPFDAQKSDINLVLSMVRDQHEGG